MAILKTPFEFTGRIGKVSAYKRKGSDKVILRMGSGPTKEQIKADPKFVRLRENNSEFKASTLLTAGIRYALFPVKHLGDSNFTGAITKRANKIQKMDTVGFRGVRNVYLSQNRQMMKGFNLNLKDPFDSILTHPLAISVNRELKTASVTIPAIVPDINLYLPEGTVFYHFIISLGVVRDIVFTGNDLPYTDPGEVVFAATAWQHAQATVEETEVQVQLSGNIADTDSLVLAIGVEMGLPDRFGELEISHREGAAKIIEVF